MTYYTPKLEEFHYGFEFEYMPPVWVSVREWTEFSWNNKAATLEIRDNCISIGGIAIKESCLRVKLLDESDILELGWEKYQGGYKIGQWYLSGQIQYQNVEIERGHEDTIYDHHSTWQELCFKGKIKNKSELKIIMKLIGITN